MKNEPGKNILSKVKTIVLKILAKYTKHHVSKKCLLTLFLE